RQSSNQGEHGVQSEQHDLQSGTAAEGGVGIAHVQNEGAGEAPCNKEDKVHLSLRELLLDAGAQPKLHSAR
ncbi:unnamed protein product, partial [Symbiodinium sp. CCMP2592]